MSKNKTIFVCSNCGGESSQWQGRCSFCSEWNTLKELKTKSEKQKTRGNNLKPSEIICIDKVEAINYKRINTSIGEFDRVLGGGIIPGSVILLGGDPGIGKSTLLMQACKNLASSGNNVLYVSGEESTGQIKLRADRMNIKSPNLHLLCETDVDEIITKLENNTYNVVVIDSIQTVYDSNYPSTPGSLVQVRECALKLQQTAKTSSTAIVLVGHVTKDGSVAGPKTLEHLVDVVLYLEGERYHNSRILRGIKNRFGATDEIGVFEMAENGLSEISNPSKIFLEERLIGSPGSVITAVMEGTRPFLVEIQAITSKTVFGYPKRAASGVDLNRLQLLIAVLQKRAFINLLDQDVYINVVGGFKINEPSADLAIMLSIASAYKNKPVDTKTVVFGEVGLSGEIRRVIHESKRQTEAKRLGFDKIVNTKTVIEAISKLII